MSRFFKTVSLNMMAILGIAIMFISLLLPGFLSVSETRISEAFPVNLSAVSVTAYLLMLSFPTLCLLLSFFHKRYEARFLMGLIAGIAPVIGLFVIGFYAPELAREAGPFARVSPSSGLWIMVFAAYVVVFASWRRLKERKVLRSILFLTPIVALVVLLSSGQLSELSIMREFANRRERFFSELIRHLVICGGAVGVGALIGIPLGISSSRSRRVERPVFAFVNFIQTVPGVALFGLLIAPLAYLSTTFPFLRQLGIAGIGWAPAMIALVLYSLLPITRNTYASLKAIPADTVEAGVGMGMSRAQILARIEIPLSLPVVLAGVRTAAIQAVGNTAMAALIGAGGLGVFIFQGLGQAAMDLVLLGAIPVVMLALFVDGMIQLLIGIVTPRGLQEKDNDIP